MEDPVSQTREGEDPPPSESLNGGDEHVAEGEQEAEGEQDQSTTLAEGEEPQEATKRSNTEATTSTRSVLGKRELVTMLRTIFLDEGEEVEGSNLRKNLQLMSGMVKGTTPVPEPDLRFQELLMAARDAHEAAAAQDDKTSQTSNQTSEQTSDQTSDQASGSTPMSSTGSTTASGKIGEGSTDLKREGSSDLKREGSSDLKREGSSDLKKEGSSVLKKEGSTVLNILDGGDVKKVRRPTFNLDNTMGDKDTPSTDALNKDTPYTDALNATNVSTMSVLSSPFSPGQSSTNRHPRSPSLPFAPKKPSAALPIQYALKNVVRKKQLLPMGILRRVSSVGETKPRVQDMARAALFSRLPDVTTTKCPHCELLSDYGSIYTPRGPQRRSLYNGQFNKGDSYPITMGLNDETQVDDALWDVLVKMEVPQDMSTVALDTFSLAIKGHILTRVGVPPWAEIFYRKQRIEQRLVRQTAALTETSQKRFLALHAELSQLKLTNTALIRTLNISDPDDERSKQENLLKHLRATLREEEGNLKAIERKIRDHNIERRALLEKLAVHQEEMRRSIGQVLELHQVSVDTGTPQLTTAKFQRHILDVIEEASSAIQFRRLQTLERSVTGPIDALGNLTNSGVKRKSIVQQIPGLDTFAEGTEDEGPFQCPSCLLINTTSPFCPLTGKSHLRNPPPAHTPTPDILEVPPLPDYPHPVLEKAAVPTPPSSAKNPSLEPAENSFQSVMVPAVGLNVSYSHVQSDKMLVSSKKGSSAGFWASGESSGGEMFCGGPESEKGSPKGSLRKGSTKGSPKKKGGKKKNVPKTPKEKPVVAANLTPRGSAVQLQLDDAPGGPGREQQPWRMEGGQVVHLPPIVTDTQLTSSNPLLSAHFAEFLDAVIDGNTTQLRSVVRRFSNARQTHSTLGAQIAQSLTHQEEQFTEWFDLIMPTLNFDREPENEDGLPGHLGVPGPGGKRRGSRRLSSRQGADASFLGSSRNPGSPKKSPLMPGAGFGGNTVMKAKIVQLNKELRNLKYSFNKRPKGRAHGSHLDDSAFKALGTKISNFEKKEKQLKIRLKQIQTERRLVGKQLDAEGAQSFAEL